MARTKTATGSLDERRDEKLLTRLERVESTALAVFDELLASGWQPSERFWDAYEIIGGTRPQQPPALRAVTNEEAI